MRCEPAGTSTAMANQTQFLMAIPPRDPSKLKRNMTSPDALVRNPAPAQYSWQRHCDESKELTSKPFKQCFTLRDFHYSKMADQYKERERLGVLNIPSKSRAAIPGYSGHVARRESMNVCGMNTKKSNLTAAGIFEAEQAESISRYTHPKDSLAPSILRSQSADYAEHYMAPAVDLRCFG